MRLVNRGGCVKLREDKEDKREINMKIPRYCSNSDGQNACLKGFQVDAESLSKCREICRCGAGGAVQFVVGPVGCGSPPWPVTL
ncbi:hypothetical protein EBZ80_27850 [bacterium]|nr:hypothetical protein [bacterium]